MLEEYRVVVAFSQGLDKEGSFAFLGRRAAVADLKTERDALASSRVRHYAPLTTSTSEAKRGFR